MKRLYGKRLLAMTMIIALLAGAFMTGCGKDHTTVIHAHDKIKKEILKNADLKREINELKKNLS